MVLCANSSAMELYTWVKVGNEQMVNLTAEIIQLRIDVLPVRTIVARFDVVSAPTAGCNVT